MVISEKNFIDYCKSKYLNQHCLDEEEFLNDLKTFKYIKTYFRKYISGNDIKIDILLNHFIYVYNCFDDNMVEIMFIDFEDYYHPLLKTFFIYLEIMPEYIRMNERYVNSESISVDSELYKKLKNSKRK